MAGYLFVHFTGEHANGEQVYFSISKDGLHWEDIGNGNPMLISDIGERGVRDPFIVRDSKRQEFYIIATDLRIEAGKGWEVAQYQGSRNMIIWKSKDLIHWSEPWSYEMDIEGAGCVWAPESIYIEGKDRFFVYWASMTKRSGEQEAKQRIFASYTKDFVHFTKPFVFLEGENHIIDTTIVYDKDWFYRFSKDECIKTIRMEKSKALESLDYQSIDSPVLDNLIGVEGPEVYQLPNGSWCLIVDQFATQKGYLPLITKDLSSGIFEKAEDYDMGLSKKRHGSVLKISDQEYERLRGY